MLNFNFYNPTRILFGKDKLLQIDKLIPENARVLVTYGFGSIKRIGLFDQVMAILSSRPTFEFGGIEPNPRFETLMKAAELVRKEKIDFILAVGGGSVLDGTKFIALAANFPGDASKLLMQGFKPIGTDLVQEAIPFGTVLTLPATGSEMNSGGVISYRDGKFPVKSDMTFPQFSVLDPSYTYSLPRIQVANGIVDAFIHTLEQYTTYPVNALLQDRMAEGILQTLIEIGETSVNEPENYIVRANHMWTATMALNGIIGAGVPQDWATHMIGHELTALFGIDHAQTLAIVYPALIDICREQKKAKLIQYGERVWKIVDGTEEERINQVIKKTSDFFESLGIKTKLSDYGLNKTDIAQVIESLQKHGLIALSENGSISPEIAQKILERAL